MENRYTASPPRSPSLRVVRACVCGVLAPYTLRAFGELDSIRLLQLWQNDLFSSVSSHTAPHLGNGVAHDENACTPSIALSTPLTFRFLRASLHRPVKTIRIHDFLKAKLCDLYENDCIFDKFECSLSGSGEYARRRPLSPSAADAWRRCCECSYSRPLFSSTAAIS
jgi:hypothetical protein